MEERTKIILHNGDDPMYVALTDEQVRLMDWLIEHGMLWDGITVEFLENPIQFEEI